MKRIIYVVEDERDIADMVVRYLEREGFEVRGFQRGDTALDEIRKAPPHLAILDIMLPGMDGLDILREVRRKMTFPVIFLTARRDEVDRVLGIEMGADDYVTKPFSARELVAKVKSVFRRIDLTRVEERNQDEIMRVGHLALDRSRRQLRFQAQSTELTPIEFALAEALMQKPGHTLTRAVLSEQAWGGEPVETRTLDVHMGNLRRKIKDIGGPSDAIRSLRGVGYSLDHGRQEPS